MSAQGMGIYRRAARHAALGWSATKSLKSFELSYMSTEWEMARKGFQDMRTHMEMTAILKELESEHEGKARELDGIPVHQG